MKKNTPEVTLAFGVMNQLGIYLLFQVSYLLFEQLGLAAVE